MLLDVRGLLKRFRSRRFSRVSDFLGGFLTRVLFLVTLGSNGPHGCVRKARDSQNPYKTCPIWTTLTREAKIFCYLGRTAPCTRIEAEKLKKLAKKYIWEFFISSESSFRDERNYGGYFSSFLPLFSYHAFEGRTAFLLSWST